MWVASPADKWNLISWLQLSIHKVNIFISNLFILFQMYFIFDGLSRQWFAPGTAVGKYKITKEFHLAVRILNEDGRKRDVETWFHRLL